MARRCSFRQPRWRRSGLAGPARRGDAPTSPALLAVAVLVQAASVASDGTQRRLHDHSGHLITTLVLDRHSDASLITKDKYLFDRFSIKAKLVAANSVGTVSIEYLFIPLQQPSPAKARKKDAYLAHCDGDNGGVPWTVPVAARTSYPQRIHSGVVKSTS